MAENKKIYITANELAEMLGVSVGHPFQVNDDEAMTELVESVKEEGTGRVLYAGKRNRKIGC